MGLLGTAFTSRDILPSRRLGRDGNALSLGGVHTSVKTRFINSSCLRFCLVVETQLVGCGRGPEGGDEAEGLAIAPKASLSGRGVMLWLWRAGPPESFLPASPRLPPPPRGVGHDWKGGADHRGNGRAEVRLCLRINGRSLRLGFRLRRSLSLGAGGGSALGGRLFRPARSSASGAHY